jgi:carbamoyl-phosphate synthase large subunit
MTGGGAPGAAGILKCLHQEPSFRVIAVDANPTAIARYLHTDFETVPFATDPEFPETILSLCRKYDIHAVLPLVTRELIPLSQQSEAFRAAGCQLVLSSPESLAIANDKASLYEFLQWRGIPVPAFRIVETTDQFAAALDELGYPANNVCFKPSVSNGSRGFRIVSETFSESDLLFGHKPSTTYIRKEDAWRILSASPFPQLLVSEFLPGPEYSVDCLASNGVPVLVVPRSRKKMIGGISVEGEFVRHEKIIAYCEEIIRALHLHGNVGIQVKESSTGEMLVLEINPRLQGTVAAALGAGINFPVLGVKQALGLPILPEELQVRWGTAFSRYWTEVYHSS